MPTPIRTGGRTVKAWPDIGHLPTATGALTATDLVAFVDVSQSPIAMRQAVAQDLVAGLAAGATEMEGATATNRIVTPRTMVNSPYAAKAWGKFTATGGIVGAVGVTYATQFATGNFRVIWDTPFSNTSYSIAGMAEANRYLSIAALNVTGADVRVLTDAGSVTDEVFTLVVFGDQ